MTQPRQVEVSLGIVKESLERDFTAEFSERDATLGADAEIFVSEQSGDLIAERLRRLGFAQYLERLYADLGIGVVEQGQ